MVSVWVKMTHFWMNKVTNFMLSELKELNILKYMDGWKTQSGELFKKVAEKLNKAGFESRVSLIWVGPTHSTHASLPCLYPVSLPSPWLLWSSGLSVAAGCSHQLSS